MFVFLISPPFSFLVILSFLRAEELVRISIFFFFLFLQLSLLLIQHFFLVFSQFLISLPFYLFIPLSLLRTGRVET